MQNSKLGAQSIQPKFWLVRPGNWSTSKGGPLFSTLFWLDGTDPLSFGPKFLEILVEWIAPLRYAKGVYLSIEGIWKGYLSIKKLMVFKFGKGLDIGAKPPHWLSSPGCKFITWEYVREYLKARVINYIQNSPFFFSLEDLLSYHPILNAI